MIDRTKIFPLMLIILQVAAAIPYAYVHDWRQAVYWIAAAMLNIAVTF